MTADFNRHGAYRDEVAEAIGFVGQDPDFFTRIKADYLVELAGRRIGPSRELAVLDVGCGIGETDRFLTGRFASIDGVDVSTTMIERARQANPDVRYAAYDGRTLPFGDDTFDLAFAICVFHHVAPVRWSALLCEMARVVKERGLLAVIEHNPYNPLTRLAVARCAFDEGVTLLRRRDTSRLFAEIGATPTDSRYLVFFPWSRDRLRRLEARIGALPLGAQYAVAGRPPRSR